MYRKELHDSDSGEMEYREFKTIIDSSERKYEFMIAENERFINLSKGVYWDKVHMPFGYLSLSGGVLMKRWKFIDKKIHSNPFSIMIRVFCINFYVSLL